MQKLFGEDPEPEEYARLVLEAKRAKRNIKRLAKVRPLLARYESLLVPRQKYLADGFEEPSMQVRRAQARAAIKRFRTTRFTIL